LGVIAETVLIDTGPLVAMLSSRDAHHARCVKQAQEFPARLYTCWPVITEAAYILRSAPSAVDALLQRVGAGNLAILSLAEADTEQIRSIIAKYGDQLFDLADVCLMHLANRESIEHVFTLDERHFSVFRKDNGQPLTLHPA
jgi:hypothetical protein